MNFECKNFLDRFMVIIMAIGIIVLYMFLSPTILALLGLLPFKDNFINNNLVLLCGEIIITGILIFIFRHRFFKDFKEFRKNPKKVLKGFFKYWLTGFILMMVSNLVINILITDGNIAANEEANREILTTLPIYSIFAMCILGPICEELLFRASFKNGFKHIIPYTLFTGILFAGMHVSSGIDSWNLTSLISNWKELLYFIPYSSLGMAFGYAFFKSDNIFSSISLHIFHNTITVLLILLSFLSGAL